MLFDWGEFVLRTSGDKIPDAERHELYLLFHRTADAETLERDLQDFDIPEHVKQELVTFKARQSPEDAQPVSPFPTTPPTPVEKGFTVIDRLGGLDVAEKHHTIAASLINLVAHKSKEANRGK